MDSKTLLITTSVISLVGIAFCVGMVFYPEQTRLQLSFKNESNIPEEIVNRFQDWAKKYNKENLLSNPEYAEYRLTVYAANYEKIKSHPKTETYTLAENQFMDLTNEEWKAIYLGYKARKNTLTDFQMTGSMKATTYTPVDWRDKGVLTPIKNQGQCGSCWAFSTTGSMEGLYNMKNKPATPASFSEQQLVDCSGSFGNQGCNGGLMDNGFKYVIKNGIVSESDYPYTAKDGTCNISGKSFQPLTGYKDVSKKLFSACGNLYDALQTQPISVAVDAEQWQFYSTGVLSKCGTQLDHGVLAVANDATGIWTIKNSWGATWGEKGFIQLAAGNTCGLCNQPSYPTD